MTERQLLLTPASMISTKRLLMLDNSPGSTIPIGTLAAFAGEGGAAKSTYIGDKIAKLTRGELPGEFYGMPQSVLVWSGEDPWESIVVPRFAAAGADLDRIFKLAIGKRIDELTQEVSPNLPEDTQLVLEAIEETGAKFVLIDPVASVTRLNTDKEGDVRAVLDPLARIADKTGAVIGFVRHLNKGQGPLSARMSGSHSFRDTVRSLFFFAVDEETGNRAVEQQKGNYSELANATMAFRLESVGVPTDDGDIAEVARVVMVGESPVSVTEILNRGSAGEASSAPERSAAVEFIVDQIESSATSELPAAEVLRSARAAGFTETEIKLARSRSRDPRIVSRKSGFGNGWVWAIEQTPAQGIAKVSKVSALPEPIPSIPSALVEGAAQGNCYAHGTPKHDGLCGRCEAEKVPA